MNLTPELKAEIEGKSYYELLRRWRYAPIGDAMFQGESGEFWGKELARKRDADPDQAVVDSKAIGWGR